MKKLFLGIVISILFVFSVNAQNFGVKAGLNVANLSGDIESNKSLIGLQIGAFVEFELSESFKLQPELLYSSQGSKLKEEGLSLDFNLNYISIPVMFKYAVADGFNLEVGPQIGFLVTAEVLDQDIKDEMESVDFGGNFGVSYDFTENIFLQARYGIGFTNVLKDGEGDKVNNSVLSFALGYKF